MASVGDNNTIGGTSAGAGNVISNHRLTGVTIVTTETGNAVLGNSIHSNTGLGIDLGNNGVNGNDGLMNGSAAGQGMDQPIFTTANLVGNMLSIVGYVGSAPNQSVFAGARIEIFLAAVDSSGYGEGQTYLTFLTADSNGNFSGVLDVTGLAVISASVLTATATV